MILHVMASGGTAGAVALAVVVACRKLGARDH